jgi:hypothetical protein
MQSYRAFFLNLAGRIEAVEIVEAESDNDALLKTVELAARQSRYSAVEVWEGARRLFPQVRGQADIRQLKRQLVAAGLMLTEHDAH